MLCEFPHKGMKCVSRFVLEAVADHLRISIAIGHMDYSMNGFQNGLGVSYVVGSSPAS